MTEEIKLPICNRCQNPIKEPMYIQAIPTLILQKSFTQMPPLFSCPEHAENYTKYMIFHDTCWIEELKEHGITIHNITEVIKKRAKEELEKKVKEG